jgi:hypothetical protein
MASSSVLSCNVHLCKIVILLHVRTSSDEAIAISVGLRRAQQLLLDF